MADSVIVHGVRGPSSATDEAIARFNGTTGKLLQNSTVTISDAGRVDITVADTANTIPLVIAQNDVTNNPIAFSATNAGTGSCLVFTQNGNTGSTPALFADLNGTGNGFLFQQDGVLASGRYGFRVYSNSTQTSSSSWLTDFVQDGASSTQPVTRIYNDGTGDALTVDVNGTSGRGLYLDRDGNSGSVLHAAQIDMANAGSGGATGLYITAATATGGVVSGLRVDAASGGSQNAAVYLASTAGSAAGGIIFGTDTTLYRSAADTLKTDDNLIIAAAGTAANSAATIDATQTLTNKRVTPRIGTTTSSATPTINTDTTDQFNITALAANITSMTTNLSGTPTDGQKLMIRFKDDGTPRTITWGASFASRGSTLLATTTAGKVSYVGLIWNGVALVWDCVATVTEA